jgi:UDP-3-O-[3-hydroxymyristoyl] glucosamine N-acyltransferase
MELTIQEIATLLSGEIQGSTDITIRQINKIQEAEEGAITFLANKKYEKYLYTTRASAVLVSRGFTPKEAVSATLIYVQDAYRALGMLLYEYRRRTQPPKTGIEQPSYIHPESQLGAHAYVGAFAYIGKGTVIGDHAQIYPHVYIGDRVRIGKNVTLFAGAKIYSNTVIGNHCTIHAGAVIGSEGFGYAPQPDGSYQPIPQIGRVVLEDYVDVGANTTIDCATLGATHIGKGVKLDNLIQIAHNVTIGQHTALAAQVGVSGSTTIGAYCMIAGQAGLVGHIEVADKTVVSAQSGVLGSVKEKGTYIMGSPAFSLKEYLKAVALFKKLPDLVKRIDKLEGK